MSVRAGSIVHVGGRNVIDRLQDAGLGNARIPIETIREIGNDLVVDKIPGEADFTFTLTSWDVTTDLLALFTGKVGNPAANQPPGYSDALHTEYKWENCKFINIASPWKGDTGSAGGHVTAGHLVPGYYPTRVRYRLGVTENAQMEAELAGAEFYYARCAPIEEVAAGDGTATAFATSEAARPYRVNGAGGTTFKYVFGVLVDGVLMVEGTDYTVTGGTAPPGPSTAATIHFSTPPANGSQVRFAYFTEVAKTYPQAVNADATLKPGAVRGRDIDVYLGGIKVGGVQAFELEATSTGTVQREMGNPSPTGRSVEGTDVTGTLTLDPKDPAAFFRALEEGTGLDSTDEVLGFYNMNAAPLEIRVRDPRDAGTIIKTIYVPDGILQPPGTPARVNQSTQFALAFDGREGTFSEFKGGRP